MGILTNIFYLISTSLLIPVMLALLWFLTRVLLALGQALREHVARTAAGKSLAAFSTALEDSAAELPELQAHGLVPQALSRLRRVADNPVLADKAVQDVQLVWQAELERLRGLSRTGPALGLMGTLIPLGPALVGLAAGDLEMMSSNLVIAFATTVVGLLVGTLAAVLLSIKRRWYQADAVLVTFAANRLPQLELPPRHRPGSKRPARSRVETVQEEPRPELAVAE
jgi:biopolymer transport protein ExbB/TolQ